MQIVIILPTFNERENIISVLSKLRGAVSKVRTHTVRYLVVDDTSPDGTADLVREYSVKHRDVTVVTGKKKGLGKALLRGMVHAVEKLGADVIIQLDADLSHDPAVVPEFIRAIDNGADFVVGSRYIPGGSIPSNWGLHRKIFSICGNAIVRYGLGYPGIHDWTGGFRAYRKKFVDLHREKMQQYGGYVFQIAFLHKSVRSGAKITEVPIHFTDRLYGRSKIAPSEYIKNVFEYVIRERINTFRKGKFLKFLMVGGFGFIINALMLVLLHEVFGWPPTLSNLTGAAAAIFSNFNLNNSWTFRTESITGIGKYFRKLVEFYATSAFGVLVIQTGTIELGVRLFGDTYYFIYFLVGTGFLLIWNFTMYSRVIWKKRADGSSGAGLS
jgi:dolichol-phosphate mannosyltransferase